ncbi:MAG TPA: helix-turn-helix transcriptional regulator [Thermoanaerobaculia bacterium]|nr:helix-turn-helix transcriptional regulator [Thermoanaerobaculia bacterium]
MDRAVTDGDLGLVVRLLRALRGWNQGELAAAAGVDKSAISDYEQGKNRPSPKTLERLAAGADVSLARLESLLPLLRRTRQGTREDCAEGQDAVGAAAVVARAVGDEVLLAVAPFAADLEAGGLQPKESPGPGERGAAAQPAKAGGREVAEEGLAGEGGWTLCLAWLCEESVRAAAASAKRAGELAGLALRLAELATGGEARRSRLAGYAWAFIANALRVSGQLRRAERAFARAWVLWDAGTAGVDEILDEARLLDLEASLRREQRRPRQALELLDRARARAAGEAAARILLKKAFTLEQMGAYELALHALAEAGALIPVGGEPRLWCVVRFNQAVNLCHLERYADAEPRLAEARRLAGGQGSGLDLLRALWLEGRVAAGLGRQEEAITILARVKEEFAARGIPYDSALAALDLAALYLESGETAEVKRLARQIGPIFEAEGVEREALVSLRVFCEAAQRETATAELARRLARELAGAPRQPRRGNGPRDSGRDPFAEPRARLQED